MSKPLLKILWIIVLLGIVVFLFNMIVQETFKQYANCSSMIEFVPTKPHVICDGVNLLLFKLDGLDSFITPLLEKTRVALLWGITAVFALASLLLTILINNFNFIIKIITFNREAWRRFIAGIQIWLICMVIFGLIFYYIVNFVINK